MSDTQRPGEWMIGLDLDHTLIAYDLALNRWAAQLGAALPQGKSLKDAVREHCRNTPEGDVAWQRAQADIYGQSMGEALPAEGGLSFLAWARCAGLPVVVVSHKSKFAAAAPDGPNLREAALAWMASHGFFDPDTGLTEVQVHFESSRAAKVARIAALGCTHFVDDLPEVFIETGFPQGTVAILYAPTGAGEGPWRTAASWRDIEAYFAIALAEKQWHGREMRLSQELEAQGISLTQLHGGRNSRVFRMDSTSRCEGVVKLYVGQTRATNEFESLRFLEQLGVGSVSRARSIQPEQGMVFYDYIEGAPARGEVQDGDIDAAISLLHAINAPNPLRGSWQRIASEAMFSHADWCANIRARIAPLMEVGEGSAAYRSMKAFVGGSLCDLLERLEESIDEDRLLPSEHRVLSPSDFGFHNAIRRTDGGLTFVDFEYFGWDDPAKLLSDFLWHPAMNLADAHKQRFTRGVFDLTVDAELLARRLPLAYALCGVKWCTILLNEFLPQHWARRAFAGDTRPREDVLAEQLDKAHGVADRVAALDGAFPYET